jgi:hypothetical protein
LTKKYLIALFNDGHDYSRKLKDGSYEPVPKSKATHKLHCTRWNPNLEHIPDVKSRLRAERTRPDGWALSVCATPLRRREGPPPRQKFKSPIKLMPVYDRQGSLAGQRQVLSAMVETHRTPEKMRRIIRKLSSEKCYQLYRVLRRASQRAEHRIKRKARRAARTN